MEPSSKRVWLVTGGSRGIGRAVVARALAGGDRVAILARSPDVANVARELMQERGGEAIGFTADVGDPAAIEHAVAAAAATWGGIDVIVNNAGLHRGGLINKLPMADWTDVLATNLSGPFQVVRAALPHMEAGGSIVNIGAVVGFRGFAGDAAYGTSKAGLAGLTQVLAAELAHRQIRSNLVIPGFVATEMTATISARAREKLIRRIPLGREGDAHEIAEVVWWVAGSTYMTGAIIPTDGGLMCAL